MTLQRLHVLIVKITSVKKSLLILLTNLRILSSLMAQVHNKLIIKAIKEAKNKKEENKVKYLHKEVQKILDNQASTLMEIKTKLE